MIRANKYVVLKREDLWDLTMAQREQLGEITRAHRARREREGKPELEVVVVESDWPEYEPTWQAIERRTDGTGVAPYPLVQMGFGKVEVGPGVRYGVPMLWFGNNGQGLGVVNEEKGPIPEGETIVAFTFANLEGLIPIEDALVAIRKMLEERAS